MGKNVDVIVTTNRVGKSADAVAAPKRAGKTADVVAKGKRAGKITNVVVPAKRAGKTADVVVAGKRAGTALGGAVLVSRRAAKGVMPIVEVRFGHVSVSVQKPTAADVKRAVTASKKVAKGLGERLVRPGVSLRHPPGVPVFTADPRDPQRVVRRLHGKVERGHFVNGQFEPEKSPA
ncbi:hypothetical protein [Paraburkholderia aspalathi]|nr:hypothetical protein [Paraburkholderia aspalathi]